MIYPLFTYCPKLCVYASLERNLLKKKSGNIKKERIVFFLRIVVVSWKYSVTFTIIFCAVGGNNI